MSRETYDAVEAALRAHVADETGGMLTNWLCVSSAVDPADVHRSSYVYSGPERMPHEALGLIAMAQRRVLADLDDIGGMRDD